MVNFFELFVDTGWKFHDMASGKPLPADELLGAGYNPPDDPGAHRHASPDAETDGQYAEDAETPAYNEGPTRIGFRSVFADLSITDRIWNDLNRELNRLTPAFLVGAEK